MASNDPEDPKGRHPEGRYANYFEVGFNSLEFLIDFGQSFEGETKPAFHTRIVTHPAFAWMLEGMLRSVLAQYEQKHGPIRVKSETEK